MRVRVWVGPMGRASAAAAGVVLASLWAPGCGGSEREALTPVPEREAPPVDAAPEPERSADTKADSGAQVSEDAAIQDPFSMMDAGEVPLAPNVNVAGAVVHEFADPPSDIVLLTVPPEQKHCNIHDGDKEYILTLTCSWEADNLCRTMNLRIKNGKATKYNAHARILSAPQKQGETGRLELEHTDETNVDGQNVPALVCD